MLRQYDPRDIIVTWGEIILQGFSDGTFVNVKYDEAAVTKHVGAQGAVTATISANRGGKATFTLGQASSSNNPLSAYASLQRRPGVGLQKKPLLVKHINGTTLVSGPETWIETEPEIQFGAEHLPREWVFDIAELDTIIGGSVR